MPVALFLVGGTGCADDSVPISAPAESALPSAAATATTGLPVEEPKRPAPRATATPTVGSPASAYAAGTRTGNEAIDRLIGSVESKDGRALAAMVRATEYPCEEPRPQSPQPLVCREGMSPGDILSGFPVTHVEGGLWPAEVEWLGDRLKANLDAAPLKLHAVYRYGVRTAGQPLEPATDYLVIFTRWSSQVGPEFDTFNVTGGRITSLHFAFPPLPLSVWTDSGDSGWVLPRLP